MENDVIKYLPETEDALAQIHDEAVFKLSVMKTLDIEIKHVLSGMNDAETKVAYDRYKKRIGGRLMQMICRKTQSAQRRQTFKKTAPRIMQIAAMVVAVVSLCAVTAIAAVPPVRARVLSLLMDVQERYTEFQLIEEQEAAFWVPQEWDGDYFPAYIPKQYTFSRVEQLGSIKTAVFADEENRILEFSEIGEGAAIQVDTENANNEYSYIHGSLCLISTKNNHCAIVWMYREKYFYLYYEGDKSEAVNIAESVVHIR